MNTSYLDIPLTWQATGNGEFPYRVEIEGRMAFIRINDFPPEPIYTLIIDDEEILNFDEWPMAWQKQPLG